MDRYTIREQDVDYRNAAWDLGCVCPVLPAHVHEPGCPLERLPEEWRDHLDQEHEDDA